MTDRPSTNPSSDTGSELFDQQSGGVSQTIIPHSISQEMSQSYIDYAMSVIISRAIPDVRDGNKPVARRILYAMYREGVLSNKKYVKSMAIVGEVLKKYHPHGDSSVYDAMARLTQPWNMRYPLVDGQGNFGSIDGDEPAAPRYTEARMTKLAEEMLRDIDQDTVDRYDTYDSSGQQPAVLPTKFPNHLCNGTLGIAVGMATNMPPHNLTEVIDASLHLIDHPDATIDDVMQIIRGPDFPTGGYIYDPASIIEVYKKGRGAVICRGKLDIEKEKKTNQIVISELPYQVNKSKLVEKIGEMIGNKKLEGITDITDESSRGAIRIVLKIKRGVDPQIILTKLYKYTDLQTNFNVNNNILVEKGMQPRTLNILDLLTEFVTFRREVVLRRSIYQRDKAEARLHILIGLRQAIDVIDEVIATIRSSLTRSEAKDRLMATFDFSAEQTEYILQLRLQTLVGLEIQKILDEIDEKEELIAYLNEIITNPVARDSVVVDELTYIKDEYGDERRTRVSDATDVYKLNASIKDLKRLEELEKEDVIVRLGIDRQIRVLYQSRIIAIPADTQEIIHTHNQDRVFAISDEGKIVIKRIKDLGSHSLKQTPLDLAEAFEMQGEVVYVGFFSQGFDYISLLTNTNQIKKINMDLIKKLKKTPTTIMGITTAGPDAKIIKAIGYTKDAKIGALSAHGNILLFKSSDVRASGKTAGGVKCMTIDEKSGDRVVDIFPYTDEMFIFVHSETKGKMLSIEDLRIQKRGHEGLQAATLVSGETLTGGLSLTDGSIKFLLSGKKIKEIHSDDFALDIPAGKLHPVTNKPIIRIVVDKGGEE